MKKITFSIICMMTLLISSSSAADYLFSGTFKLQFEDNTKIRVGSAVENKSANQWKSGSKVGDKDIEPETFEKLKASTTDMFKVDIAEKGVGNIRDIWITDLTNNTKVKGVYDVKKRGFSIGKSQKAGENKIETAVIKGYFNEDFSTISKGEYQIGFLAGKSPLVVAADATFFYTATVVKDKEVKSTDVKQPTSATKPTNVNITKEAYTKEGMAKEVSEGSIINKWKIASHKKGYINIPHGGTDFIEFSSNGVYSHLLKGHEEKGKWIFNDDGTKIIVTGEKEVTWNVKSNKDGNYILSKGNETLILKPF